MASHNTPQGLGNTLYRNPVGTSSYFDNLIKPIGSSLNTPALAPVLGPTVSNSLAPQDYSFTGDTATTGGINRFLPNYGIQSESSLPYGPIAGNNPSPTPPTQDSLFTGSDYINGALGGAQLGLGIYEQFFDPTAKKFRTAAADSAQSTAELNRAKVQNYKDRKAFSANIDEKALAAGREYRKDSPNYQKGL